ncbi:MAG: hypothetical protein HYV09_38205 [Deltaproteobacteria bacterium]|nr:hypothetical protein [Deltaproteobacteria bacterium]
MATAAVVHLAACGGSSQPGPPPGDAGTEETPFDAPPEASGDGAVLGEACVVPGALACAGHAQEALLVCDGVRWIGNGTCAKPQLCDTRPGPTLGSCQDPDPRCVGRAPGETFCDGRLRGVCGPDLLDATVAECASAEHCDRGSGAKCAVCIPGASRCVENDLEKCSDDGQRWELNITCGSPALCDPTGAKCTTPTCAPGGHRCTGDLLEKCNTLRTAYEPVKLCGAGLCDAAVADCRACVPGTKDCSGAAPRTCDSTGKWVAAAACSGTTPLCNGGLCSAGACAPGEYKCSGDVLQQCNASLTAFEPVAVCKAGLCDAAAAECDECKHGDASCVGNTPRACDTTGHWKSLTACSGSSPVCSAGVCVAGSCVTGEHRCSGDVLEKCNASNDGFEVVEACSPGMCDAPLRQCDECRYGANGCLGSVPRECDSTRHWSAKTACASPTPTCRAGLCVATPKGWIDIATPTLSPRSDHTAVWTGTAMIVWGGGGTADGASYDPIDDVWSLLPSTPFYFPARSDHVAVWSGNEMIVWGGSDRNDGATYNPSTRKWRLMRGAALGTRSDAVAVWSTTTNEMLVWGGRSGSSPVTYPREGGRYDPLSDNWSEMALPPSTFAGRVNHAAVWTGTKMVIFGGYNSSAVCSGGYNCGDAAAYDPVTNTWTLLTPPSPALDARRDPVGVATTAGAAFWGGTGNTTLSPTYRSTGAVFGGSAWTAIPSPDAVLSPAARGAVMGWSHAGQLYVWGGVNGGPLGDGAVYDLALAAWSPMSSVNAPSVRARATVVWTGYAAILWGGTAFTLGGNLNDGKMFWP